MTTDNLNHYGYCPAETCGCAIIQRDRDPSGSSRCSMGHFTLTRDVHAEPLVQRARAAKLEAERQALRDEGAAAERAAVLAELRDDLLGCEVLPERTEDYVRELIEEIAAGRHVRPVEGA
jgi:Xaa-Pro aminopeptidase